MYKMINIQPTKEQVDHFGMTMHEDDSFMNFHIDLETTMPEKRDDLHKTFGLDAEKLREAKKLTLSVPTEV